MASNPPRILIRLLDRKQYLDYLIALIIGACPIGLSFWMGVHNHIKDYVGYFEQPNWWSLALLLPAILWALRWAMHKMMPVNSENLPTIEPPIITIIRDSTAKTLAYSKLRQCILAQENIRITLLLTVLIHVLDMWPLMVTYVTDTPFEFKDWKSMYLLKEAPISKAMNLLLVCFAYYVQFCATFLGILSIILMFRHNYFFLMNVYQHHSLTPNGTVGKFQIDVNDVDRCFGFRIANEAFNTQIKGLMIAGAAMFLSRYATAGQSGNVDFFHWSFALPRFSFPLAGQWLMALFWLIALLIVSMPAFVKLLPRFHDRSGHLVGLTLEGYLREFFSDQTWPKDKAGRDESVAVVASKFAKNSFWPTGDNRAGALFFFSYWIFLVILLPPDSLDLLTVAITFVVYGAVAYGLRLGTFKGLKWALSYVDEMLVIEMADSLPPVDRVPQKDNARIFISYRRSDTKLYAHSIHKHLSSQFFQENIFIDLKDIEPGEKFKNEIEIALALSDVVIVLMGKEWSKVTGTDGNPRINDPNDMVRFEVVKALELGKRIIPVLVSAAKMPSVNELPEPIKELSQINALEISDHHLDYDLDVLARTIKTFQE